MHNYLEDLFIGFDAARIRSGGGIAHLIGLLSGIQQQSRKPRRVHVWSYKKLLNELPDYPWLTKSSSPLLNSNLFASLFWQRFVLPLEFKSLKCDILLNLDAASISKVQPNVVISQDLLAFETGEIARLPKNMQWLRLIVIKQIQIRALENAQGVIFLSKYAKKMLSPYLKKDQKHGIVHHGIDPIFLKNPKKKYAFGSNAIRCVYVSATDSYKHQWCVVDAIAQLRHKGLMVSLELIGGGKGFFQKKLEKVINKTDPYQQFVTQIPFLDKDNLALALSNADIFVFASSCENLPITLLEAMASGLPIACSNRGPMPEVLGEWDAYFNPENPGSIAEAIEYLILNEAMRRSGGLKFKELAKSYNWISCASKTLKIIHDSWKSSKGLE